MADEKPKPPGHPVGEAIDWTDEDLDKLSEIGPEDISSARAQFRRQAPKEIKRLLDPQKPE